MTELSCFRETPQRQTSAPCRSCRCAKAAANQRTCRIAHAQPEIRLGWPHHAVTLSRRVSAVRCRCLQELHSRGRFWRQKAAAEEGGRRKRGGAKGDAAAKGGEAGAAAVRGCVTSAGPVSADLPSTAAPPVARPSVPGLKTAAHHLAGLASGSCQMGRERWLLHSSRQPSEPRRACCRLAPFRQSKRVGVNVYTQEHAAEALPV